MQRISFRRILHYGSGFIPVASQWQLLKWNGPNISPEHLGWKGLSNRSHQVNIIDRSKGIYKIGGDNWNCSNIALVWMYLSITILHVCYTSHPLNNYDVTESAPKKTRCKTTHTTGWIQFFFDTFIKYFLSILDRNCTSSVISFKYSEFYRISFGYLHPEIVILIKRGENTMVQFESNHPCIHTLHSLQWWKVDQLGFHLSFLKGCISGCRSPNVMG